MHDIAIVAVKPCGCFQGAVMQRRMEGEELVLRAKQVSDWILAGLLIAGLAPDLIAALPSDCAKCRVDTGAFDVMSKARAALLAAGTEAMKK